MLKRIKSKKWVYIIAVLLIICALIIVIIKFNNKENNINTIDNAGINNISQNENIDNTYNNEIEQPDIVEETIKSDEELNIEFAQTYEIDYSTIQTLLNNDSLIGYFNPEYKYTEEIRQDDNGNYYYEQHYIATDFQTTGQFSNLMVDITYGKERDNPVSTIMTIECSNNPQAYTQLLIDLEQSISNLYDSESIKGTLGIGNTNCSLNLGDKAYTINQSTSIDTDNNFLLYYSIIEDDNNKSFISLSNEEIEELEMNNMFKAVKFDYNSDEFKNIIKENTNVKGDVIIYGIYMKSDFENIDKSIGIKIGESSKLQARAIQHKKDDLTEYSLELNTNSKASKLVNTAVNLCRTFMGVEITDEEFEINEESSEYILKNEEVYIKISNNNIYIATANSSLDLSSIIDTHTELETELYDDNGNLIDINSENMGNPNDIDPMYQE